MKNKKQVLQEIFDNDPLNILDISHDKGNKLIAEFMGYTDGSDSLCLQHPDLDRPEMEIGNLEYNSSWNWLMPVISKVSHLITWPIYENYFQANMNDFTLYMQYDINETWGHVVEFIEWYNENK